MTYASRDGNVLIEDLELLTFTVMGVRIGVDTGQIERMVTPEAAEGMGVDYSPLHERLSFGGMPVKYDSPRVLVIKGEKPPTGILIDFPDDISSFRIDSLRPLPQLFESCGVAGAVWGAAIRDKEVILLLDFYKLAET